MDPVNIDKNMRSIKSIERSWSQPELPDLVSLDLAAMSGLNQKNLSEFLWGLDADITKVETQPTPTLDLRNNIDLMSKQVPVGVDQTKGTLGPTNWNVFWSDIAGLQPATNVSEDAVLNWKEQAMERGQIPAVYDQAGNYSVDNVWGPEYQSVWNEQTQDHYESSFRGNKYGAISLQSVAEHMAEWVSPTGLFKAAVALDFVPDFEEIAEETTWNPLTWWKAVDDLALPVINWGLMLSGVGNVVLIGRGIYVGAKAGSFAAKGVASLDKAYDAYKTFHGATIATKTGKIASQIGAPVGKIGTFGTHVGKHGGDLNKAGQAALKGVRAPGWIGSKMASSSNASFQAIGKGSNWWRNKNAVSLGKGMTQQGMRLGLAGRIEGLVGLEDSGAYGLDYIPGVDKASNFMYDEIIPSIIFESMFTPVTLLASGSLKALGPAKVLRSFSNVGERANVSEDLFESVDDVLGLEITLGRADGIDVSELEAARKTFQANVKEHGKTKALMFYLHDDWVDIASEAPVEVQEQFGGFVTYLATMAAADHAALNVAPDLARTALDQRSNLHYHVARNTIINQLRYIDPDDINQMLVMNAWNNSNSQIGFVNKLEESLAQLEEMSPAMRQGMETNIKDQILIHNSKRQEVFKELMTSHLNAGVLKDYMSNHLTTLGKTWKEFSDGMDMINVSVAEGGLDGAKFSPAIGDNGVSLMDESLDLVEDSIMVDIMKIMEDPEYLKFAKNSKTFNPLMKAPSRNGRFTVAKKDTMTKQTKLTHVAAVNQMLHLHKTIKGFLSAAGEIQLSSAVKDVLGEGYFSQIGGDLAQIDLKQLENVLKKAGLKGGGASSFTINEVMETMVQRRARLLRLMRYGQAQGIKANSIEDFFDAVGKHMDEALEELNKDWRWDSPKHWNVDDIEEGLDTITSLKAKSANLQQKARVTASEIDVSTIPAKLAADLEANGYKLVHGVEFATPADLNDFMVEMVDLKDATRYRESLGLEGSAFADHINSGISKANYLRARASRTVAKPFNRFTRHQERALYTAQLRQSVQRNFRHLNEGEGLTVVQEGKLDAILTDLVGRVSKEYRAIMSHKALLASSQYQGNASKMANNLRVSFTPVVPTDLVRTKPLQRLLVAALSKGTFNIKTPITQKGLKVTSGFNPYEARSLKVDIDFLVPNEAAALKKAKLAKDSNELVKAQNDYNLAKHIAANKVIDSLKEAQVVGPQLRGRATNWLDKISANKNLTNTLRLLGYVEYDGLARRIGGTSVRIAGGAVGANAALNYSPGFENSSENFIENMTKPKNIALGLVGFATGRALSTRLMVGSQSSFKKARFRDHKLLGMGVPIKAVLGNAEDATLLRASLKKVEDSKTFYYNKKELKGILNRHAARIDAGVKRGGGGVEVGTGTMKAWSYLGDHLSMWRDFARFTLSPVFDASRYSEAIVLGQIAAPEGVNLRFNISPSTWRKTRAKGLAKEAGDPVWSNYKTQAAEEFDQVRARYKNAASRFGDYDYNALESATARFSQVGILGFNTYEWETSVFADLVLLHGMDDIDAYKAAKHMFTYGVKPRSAAEVNINAIFFPFSFTKKTIGHAADFAMQDWSRTAMIHNSLRTYYELDDKYNLDDMYEKYLPLFDKVSRLNLLANGVALGQFGGANRPLLDTVLNVPLLSEGSIQPVINSPIMNAYLPQVFDVSTPNSLTEAVDSFERMIPLINDLGDLWEDAQEQTYMAIGSPSNITRRAERMEGAKAAQVLKETWDTKIREVTKGEKDFSDMSSSYFDASGDGVSNIKQMFDIDMEQIYTDFPEYKDSIGEGVARGVEMQQKEKDYMKAYHDADDSGLTYKAIKENGTHEQKIGALLSIEDAALDEYGRDRVNLIANVPPEDVDWVRKEYISWVESDPTLLPYYRRHLQSTWGPIEIRKLSE